MNPAKLSPKPEIVNDGRFVAVMLSQDFSIGKSSHATTQRRDEIQNLKTAD